MFEIGNPNFIFQFVKYENKTNDNINNVPCKWNNNLVLSDTWSLAFTNYRALIRYLGKIIKKANKQQRKYKYDERELKEVYLDILRLYKDTHKKVNILYSETKFLELENYLNYVSNIIGSYVMKHSVGCYWIYFTISYAEKESKDIDENMLINVLALGKE